MITAPFNFVPLSEKVFFPDWAEKVSHDVPFEDTQSGVIDITITAKSPMFVRNHEVNESDESKYYENGGKKISTEFCNHNGEYYIPGTSIKGMVRNVLEIMSFSRIVTQDKKFSYRDIDSFEYKNKLINNQKNIQCGWLYKENSDWKVIELGGVKQFKITHNDLADVLENRSVLEFKGERFTPEKKYAMYGNNIEKLKTSSGDIAVFTGTVNPLEDKEYMLPFPEKKQNDLTVGEMSRQTFIDAYYIGQPEVSKVWKSMWESEFARGGFVPIFYLKEKNILKHFGLSLLYKLPYENSVHSGIGAQHKDLEKLDLAETMFGYVGKAKENDEKEKSLKGRVSFSHSKVVGVASPMGRITKILSSPKAGYYPSYIEQKNKYKLETMDEKKFAISGWKQYPLHSKTNTKSEKGSKTTTSFNPLSSGTKFQGKIRFHNLKKFELGALLSALTLHGNNEDFFHSIGMAKPFGFGEINLEISMEDSLYIDALKEYESKMEAWSKDEELGSWMKSEQIIELFSMKQSADDSKLEYMGFEVYGTRKKDNVSRQRYSKISKASISLDSFCDGTMEKKILERSIANKKKAQIEQELNERVSNTPNRNSTEFKKAIEKYVRSRIDLPYYEYTHLKLVLEKKENDIEIDDIYNAYCDLIDDSTFVSIEPLLLKRETNQATDLELAELFELLNSQTGK